MIRYLRGMKQIEKRVLGWKIVLALGLAGAAVVVPVMVQAADAGRNTVFTQAAQSQNLTEVEKYYQDFAEESEQGSTAISLNLAKNAYRNLEMFLDNGYLMDYSTLASYTAEYLEKKGGVADSFYNIMTDCLNNPYLLNRPAAAVTATTYNGRDYSPVFDAAYYYANNADLQVSIGNNPAELLRHFVEHGVTEGRRGNAAFDVNAYVLQTDAHGKYSYSLANYYGKFLNHYAAMGEASTVPGTAPAALSAVISAGAYTETGARSVYTNEPIGSAKANLRPLAVMMPTDKAAQPSYGIGQADILYEIMEEGNISRQMAILPGWTGMERIGNLRSCRLYYIPLAKEWDPILIHFGGVAYMKGVIDAADVNNLSGTYEYGTGGKAPGAGSFYRTSDRVAPHNAYISSAGIQKACTQLGYQTSLRNGYYNPKHFTFAAGVNDLSQYGSSAMKANAIDLSKVFSYTKSALTYNAADGFYYKNIHGGAQVDALSGKQIAFANVIVQNTVWKQLDKKGYLSFNVIDAAQDGYYFTKGKCIHITWKKTGDYTPTVYYDDNGNVVQFNTGKTYIAIAQEGKEVSFK